MYTLLSTITIADYIGLFADSNGGDWNFRPNPDGPYKGIKNQNKNQQQESNLTNQQDEFKENEDKGGRVPLWPCRAAPKMDKPYVWKRGQQVQVEYQSNNQHAGYVEFNLFANNGKEVFQAYGPQKAGAGIQRAGTTITIPEFFPKCGPEDGCFLQFYFYSKEPRNYVTCADFIIEGEPTAGAPAGTTPAVDPTNGAVIDPTVTDPTDPTLTLTKRAYGGKCAAPAMPQAAGASPAETAPGTSYPSGTTPITQKATGTDYTPGVEGVMANGTTAGMRPVVPYDDATFYETTSTDYEMYAGQAPPERIPPSALTMWKLTEPAEVGSKSTLPKDEQEKRKNFRGTIKTLTEQAESVYRCYQQKEAKTLGAQAQGVKMMENKGNQDDFGYFDPSTPSAYTAKVMMKKTPGDVYEPADAPMQILSDPNGREEQTTYIDLPDGCIDAVYDGVMAMQAGGELEAEKTKIRLACVAELQKFGITDCLGDSRTEAEKNAKKEEKKPNPDDVKPTQVVENEIGRQTDLPNVLDEKLKVKGEDEPTPPGSDMAAGTQPSDYSKPEELSEGKDDKDEKKPAVETGLPDVSTGTQPSDYSKPEEIKDDKDEKKPVTETGLPTPEKKEEKKPSKTENLLASPSPPGDKPKGAKKTEESVY